MTHNQTKTGSVYCGLPDTYWKQAASTTFQSTQSNEFSPPTVLLHTKALNGLRQNLKGRGGPLGCFLGQVKEDHHGLTVQVKGWEANTTRLCASQAGQMLIQVQEGQTKEHMSMRLEPNLHGRIVGTNHLCHEDIASLTVFVTGNNMEFLAKNFQQDSSIPMHTSRTGVLTLTGRGQLVLLLDKDPAISQAPIFGLWVAGNAGPASSYTRAAIYRYLHQPSLPTRPTDLFLLLTSGPQGPNLLVCHVKKNSSRICTRWLAAMQTGPRPYRKSISFAILEARLDSIQDGTDRAASGGPGAREGPTPTNHSRPGSTPSPNLVTAVPQSVQSTNHFPARPLPTGASFDQEPQPSPTEPSHDRDGGQYLMYKTLVSQVDRILQRPPPSHPHSPQPIKTGPLGENGHEGEQTLQDEADDLVRKYLGMQLAPAPHALGPAGLGQISDTTLAYLQRHQLISSNEPTSPGPVLDMAHLHSLPKLI